MDLGPPPYIGKRPLPTVPHSLLPPGVPCPTPAASDTLLVLVALVWIADYCQPLQFLVIATPHFRRFEADLQSMGGANTSIKNLKSYSVILVVEDVKKQ